MGVGFGFGLIILSSGLSLLPEHIKPFEIEYNSVSLTSLMYIQNIFFYVNTSKTYFDVSNYVVWNLNYLFN